MPVFLFWQEGKEEGKMLDLAPCEVVLSLRSVQVCVCVCVCVVGKGEGIKISVCALACTRK
jgi:hypothetical protein